MMNDSSVISIDNMTAAQGQKISGKVPISVSDGSRAEIPITIIRGIKNGPTLLVLAGVHGSEYTPIVATQQLAKDIEQLQRGTIILVHMANLPSYLGRTIYTSPIDGKNLNRVFPGSSNGSLTERIANFLVQEVYPQASAVLDMHSGDANEALGPSYTAYYGKAGSSRLIQASKDMARAFGLDLLVEFQWELSANNNTNTTKAIWAGSAAVVRGIPSIDVEMAPGKGLYDPTSIEQAYQGVLRVMEHIGIEVRSSTDHPSKDKVKLRSEPCLVTQRHFIEATVEGSWVPIVDTGTFVKEGTLLGYTTDLFGRERTFEALAPRDGLLLIRFEAPPVHAGDTLAVVAVLNASDSACDQFRRVSLTKNDSMKTCIVWQLIVATGGWVVMCVVLVARRRRKYAKHTALPKTDEHSFGTNQVV